MRVHGKSLAAQGLSLPLRSITGRVAAPELNVAPVPGPVVQSNLAGWIVPQAVVRWLGPGIAYYTPQKVEQIFRSALAGDLNLQWEMFDLMEATWPRLQKNLGQLKDVVVSQFVQRKYCVKAARVREEEPTDEAVECAAFVEEALWGMKPRVGFDENDFEDTIRDLLDARGKGISILEIEWESRQSGGQSGGQSGIVPRATRWVHPAWYGFPQGSGAGRLMLRRPVARQGMEIEGEKLSWPGDTSRGWPGTSFAGGYWSEFPEHKFVVGLCKGRTGHPLGSAMLHVLGFAWAASNFSAEWFLNFCQVFGQPFRWATYDPNMTPPDQAKLQAMLTNMGSSAWGMFPQGTAFELKDVAKGSSELVQKALLDWADKVCDLVVLRQTLTSDVSAEGGARALGEVHQDVLGNVETAVATWACKTLKQLIDAICALNYGPDCDCVPRLGPAEQEEEDAKELADTLVAVNNAGLEPTDEAIPEIGERLGFEVQRKAAVANPMIGGEKEPQRHGDTEEEEEEEGEEEGEMMEEEEDGMEASEGAPAKAGTTSHPSDAVAARKAEALGKTYRGAMAPFREIILASASREECLVKLSRAYADWSPGRLLSELEEALQICAAAGAVEEPQRHRGTEKA